MIRNILTFCLIAFSSAASINAQTLDEKYSQDVKSIDAIIDAYYDVISGSSTDPWQFERDRYIHSANAVITKIDENGAEDSHSLEAEYVPFLLSPREDFYEVELKRIVSSYGHMAQVWSAYEVRTDPNVSTSIRGLNSIQLRFDSDRWWIDSWTTQAETTTQPIVEVFLEEN